MASRGGGGGADRQPNRYFDRYHRPKRRLYDSTDFDDYYVSDRDSLPPDTKRARPTTLDYNGAVPFLVEQRAPPSPEAPLTEPEYPGRTPPPPALPSWSLVSRYSPDPDSGSEISESFLIRRGDELVTAAPPPLAADMKRTASGLAIRSDILEPCASIRLLEDEEAANRVREHMTVFRRYNRDSKHERILRSIINPRSMAAEYPLDDASLQSIFSAANEIFFNGRLSQRVVWDWSHDSDKMFHSGVIGNTAVRTASKRGFETLIVLSAPILRNQKYSRRLLISTFLHELIHSYLFICCGLRARRGGGHTAGFHTIAKLIDDWAGAGSQLYLSKMEADLDGCFRPEGQPAPASLDHGSPPPQDVNSPCSGCDEHYRNTYSPDPDHYSKDDSRWGYLGAGRPFQPGAGGPGDDFGQQYVYTDDDMPPMAASHMYSMSRISPRY